MGPKSVYIIAEAGVNHNGSLDLAFSLVDAAAQAGADAVKFQTFQAEKLASRVAPQADYQKQAAPEASQLEMLRRLELTEEGHRQLIEYCGKKGVHFLSTPFDEESVDLLANTFGLSLLKLSSGEITNGPLLLKAARSGKPIILSTGMSTLGEVEGALGVLAFGYLNPPDEKPSEDAFQRAYCSEKGQGALKNNVTLLHCTTEYPAPVEEVNLLAMDTLKEAFGLPVGYSDHTRGIAVPIAAVARGAAIIEKHFTLDRTLPGPDHQASLEPGELAAMVASIRQVEKALGSRLKVPSVAEMKNKAVARRSLVAARDIRRGESFTEENLTIKRPGSGISAMQYWEWLGRKAEKDYQQDELILP